MGTVQIPAVAVFSQQTGLQADLRTSLRFSENLPDNVRLHCADDITRLRTNGKLWILPATPCRIRISIQLLGRVSSQTLDLGEVARWIEDCEIWERLRLRVRHCEVPGNSTLGFSLQHPDLSASFSCPATAVKAELHDLLCQVEITQPPEVRQLKKRKRGNVGGPRDEAVRSRSATFGTGEINSQLRYNESMSAGCIATTFFEDILQAAITVLITGSVRHLENVTVKQGNIAHALARLIPAVFNVPYVKAISDRSQYMTTITSALSAMQHTAQSPALRRKVWSLADRGGIKKHLWYSILSQVKPASLPGPKPATVRQNTQVVNNAVADHDLGPNLICFGEDLFSSNLQDGLSGDAEQFLIKEDSPTVRIDYDAFESTLPFAVGEFAEAAYVGGGGVAQMSGKIEDMIEFGSEFFTMETYFDM